VVAAPPQLSALAEVEPAVKRQRPREADPVPLAARSAGGRFVYAPESEATLTFKRDGAEETSVTLKGETRVGRHASNDLVIKDLHVSSHHARLVRRGDGIFEVIDLESAGGTFVNDEQVERRALASGDRIDFSTVSALFRYVAGSQCMPEEDPGFGATLAHPMKPARAKRPPPAAMAESHGRLVLTIQGIEKMVMPLAGETTIGRREDNNLVITEEHV
jgi:hypothetical protein